MNTPSVSVSPQFKALKWQLLLSSVGVMGLTLAVAGLAVYEFVAHSLMQKSDRQLEVLADAAAHSLAEIERNPAAIAHPSLRALDNDGDLDLPWQDLQQPQQSIEWFGASGQRLGQAGATIPDLPLNPAVAQVNSGDWRILTIPVSIPDAAGLTSDQLQGYIRVSTSMEGIDEELERLRQGLVWGGLSALVICGMGGWWLTRQSLQPIERSVLQLKQFTADASHELHNPLTVIRTSIEVMQSHPERVHAADQPKLEAIASATAEMSQLVDDLLWLARTDGDLTTQSTWVLIPLHELLEEVVDGYTAAAQQKHLRLTATLKPDSLVYGDASQLKRLFLNLLANALHYTPEGGAVTITALRHDHWATVEIEDTGIGIAPDQLPLVFDRFWRADPARSRRDGGVGLGLAIAQAIAHRHGGEISVRSQLGVGSCFQVRLPTA